MSNKTLQKNLIVSLGEKLAIFGFDKRVKQQSFYRTIEGGWAGFHLSFINHADDFDITVDVAVRFNEVEDLVNSQNNLLTKKEKESTSTLGVELGNLSIGKQKRWSVATEDQVLSVVDSILDTFEHYGEPYLLKYSTINSTYELLSSDEKNAWKHCPFHATRAKKAIAIAKLLNLPDIDNQIAARKKFLEEIKDFGLSDFVNFTKTV